MKKVNESVKAVRNTENVFSQFSEEEILSIESMSHIRGGDGDGGGNIIIIPPHPLPPTP